VYNGNIYNMYMDYKSKYYKYKNKYLFLKQQFEIDKNYQLGGKSGGKSGVKSGGKNDYQQMLNKRHKELQQIDNTKSFIPKNKLSSKNKIYVIHDNYYRPFIVVVNNESISVHKQNGKNSIYEEIVTKIPTFIGYWLGFDSSTDKNNGNSILVKVTSNKYIYVGPEIYSFYADDKIIDYVSPIGNNDAPYPVAYGTENIYFMLDKVYGPKDNFTCEATVANAEDIYGEFYGHIICENGMRKKESKRASKQYKPAKKQYVGIPMKKYKLLRKC
jgi:hypothetical protein